MSKKKQRGRRYELTVVTPRMIVTDEQVCRAWIKELEKQFRQAKKTLRGIMQVKR